MPATTVTKKVTLSKMSDLGFDMKTKVKKMIRDAVKQKLAYCKNESCRVRLVERPLDPIINGTTKEITCGQCGSVMQLDMSGIKDMLDKIENIDYR